MKLIFLNNKIQKSIFQDLKFKKSVFLKNKIQKSVFINNKNSKINFLNNKNQKLIFKMTKNQENIFLSAKNKNILFKNQFKPYFSQVHQKLKTFNLRVLVETTQGNFYTIGHHNMHHFHHVCILSVIIVCSLHANFYLKLIS